jgi:hypothetical protein
MLLARGRTDSEPSDSRGPHELADGLEVIEHPSRLLESHGLSFGVYSTVPGTVPKRPRDFAGELLPHTKLGKVPRERLIDLPPACDTERSSLFQRAFKRMSTSRGEFVSRISRLVRLLQLVVSPARPGAVFG